MIKKGNKTIKFISATNIIKRCIKNEKFKSLFGLKKEIKSRYFQQTH